MTHPHPAAVAAAEKIYRSFDCTQQGVGKDPFMRCVTPIITAAIDEASAPSPVGNGETPRTDEKVSYSWEEDCTGCADAIASVPADFARQLEREADEWKRRTLALSAELTALREQVRALEEERERNAWTVSPAMAQAQIDRLNDANDRLALQVAALERDKARLDWLLKQGVAWRDCYGRDWQPGEWLYAQQGARGEIDAAMTPPPNTIPHA